MKRTPAKIRILKITKEGDNIKITEIKKNPYTQIHSITLTKEDIEALIKMVKP